MKDEAIRQAVLAGKSERIRRLLLNDDQVALVEMIRQKREITSSFLASHLNTSVQNACAKLDRLYSAGYIKRRVTSAASGGIEYVYYCPYL